MKLSQEILPIKYPSGIERTLMEHRKEVVKYDTNPMLRIYGSYCILKALTTSGVIKDYQYQVPLFKQVLKATRPTIFKTIDGMVKNGLATISNGNLYLASWKDSCQALNFTFEDIFTYHTYNLTNKNETPIYFFYLTEIKENQQTQLKAIQKKLAAIPGFKQVIDEAIMATNINISKQDLAKMNFVEYCKVWYQSQQRAFVTGTEHLNTLHSLRCDYNRCISTLSKAWSMVNKCRTIAYIKRKLQDIGYLTILKTDAIISKANVRIRKFGYADRFNKIDKQPVWYLCDQLICG